MPSLRRVESEADWLEFWGGRSSRIPAPVFFARRALSVERNPFFRKGFRAAWVGPQGRVAAFVRGKIAFYGFERFEDEKAREAFLAAALTWARGKGAQDLWGPLPLSPRWGAWLGFSVKGERRFVYSTRENSIPAPLEATMEKLKQNGKVSIRCASVRNLKRDADMAFEILSEAGEENSKEDWEFFGRAILPVMLPEWIRIAEVAGKPAAFGWMVPDLTETQLHPWWIPFALRLPGARARFPRARVVAVAALPAYKDFKLHQALVGDLVQVAGADRVSEIVFPGVLNPDYRTALIELGATPG